MRALGVTLVDQRHRAGGVADQVHDAYGRLADGHRLAVGDESVGGHRQAVRVRGVGQDRAPVAAVTSASAPTWSQWLWVSTTATSRPSPTSSSSRGASPAASTSSVSPVDVQRSR